VLKKFGLAIAKHPIIVITTWLIIVGGIFSITIGGIFGENLFDRLKNEAPTVSSSSQKADDLIDDSNDSENYTETTFIVLDNIKLSNTVIADDFNELKISIEEDGYTLVSAYGIPTEVSDITPELQNLISDNGFVILITTEENNKVTQEEGIANVYSYAEKFAEEVQNSVDGSKVLVGGETAIIETINAQAEKDLAKGELISLPIALIVLLLIFGGFLAAGMPLLGAGVSIISALGTLYGLSYFMNVQTSVMNVLTVIGLGLSIDYGLLMISRFREVLRKQTVFSRTNIQESVAETIHTAGRTVLFSGITVAVATSALLLFEPSIMKSIGVAASAVVALAIIASLTLLPAIFSLLGEKLIKPSILQKIPGLGSLLKRFGDVAPSRGAFSKLTGAVQKKPLLVVIATTIVLVFLGSSVATLNVSNLAVKTLPSKTEQGQLFNIIDKDYPALNESEIILVIDSAKSQIVNNYETYVNKLSSLDKEAIVTEDHNITTISFNTSSKDIKSVVLDMRNYINEQGQDETVYVTGDTARDIDYVNSLADTAPWVALIIMLVTGLLLFLMTGSIIIPIKAIVLSTLSLGASVGILVWGFEYGNLAPFLGFNSNDITGIDPLILVLVLTFGFGLAMDYEMFLISRIKEKHDHGASTSLSVRSGLQASGRIITSAALIIVLVFIGFAFGDMLMIKQIGVALAVAVIIDATIVRCLLMPAIITLLGDKIWWAPKWMKKIYNRFGVKH